MYNQLILSFIILFLLTGCSVFDKNKTVISTQNRFEKAQSYLSNNKFEKAKNEFQVIIDSEKGTGLSLES